MGPHRDLAALLREVGDDVLDALYPRCCALCRARSEDGVACDEHALPCEPPGARCAVCASPLPRALAEAGRCAACRRESPGFSRLVVLADYRAQPQVRDWILAFKHGSRPDLAGVLGAALAGRWQQAAGAEGARLEPLVPVPLHRWRRLERGYDQALLLARAVARSSGARVVRALVRARPTAVQGSAGAVSRAANVRAAFRAARWPPGAARAIAATRRVWLVDDVVTSGATLRECARELRRMGAREVSALALARAAAGAVP